MDTHSTVSILLHKIKKEPAIVMLEWFKIRQCAQQIRTYVEYF